MEFQAISDAIRLQRLEPPRGRVRMVLDTDTYNEIDDQFAVVYSLLSPKSMTVEALYAAPFSNDRSQGPGDGMEKSYQEILRLLSRLNVSSEGLVYRGSTGYLSGREHPERSAAAMDLVNRAMATSDNPLYVVAIGAITNVASAILIEPEIVKRIVVVWLGGHPIYWPDTKEFNLGQDIAASRLILDCGAPLIQLPCQGVTSHMLTSVPEMEFHVRGQGAIGDYLFEIFREYVARRSALSKVIWDVAAIAYVVNAAWVPTQVVHSPILTDQLTWSIDHSRHFIRQAVFVDRDAIFGDLFKKLQMRNKA